ncbi:MAG TPA: metallophosphoesterase family protein [Pyrinomonadaceae bacterium]|nr:metallophosphoesterase family protein [Pyrinomonadaceae bacterium]
MISVAAIYDIHGNLPALEAVLQEIRQAQVDLVVVGGDILPGPMPRETLARLLELEIPVQFIQGNCEIDALAEKTGGGALRVPEQYREIVRWSARQLSEYEELLAGWAKTLRIKIGELGEVLFCHATPRDDNEIFTRLTAEDQLLPIFEGLGVSLVVCGHTHMQFDRMVGSVRVVNAGSVGMPFGEPGADWLLLGSGVQLRHTPYDLTQAAERIRQTSYPEAQDFVSNYLLQPPSEKKMLEVFSRATLK